MNLGQFKKTIWNYYAKNGRHNLPWRKTKDPYKILVSEVMLQETQVSRVIEKHKSFLKKFPTVQTLANAHLKEVLLEWQGLGYNRRAKYLKLCAEKVIREYGDTFPKTFKELVALPGIGPATAGDLLAFAYNIPVPVIETNIRSVFIHFFFPKARPRGIHDQDFSPRGIDDRDLLPLIEQTLDTQNPREWYWALFDYGAFLKQTRNPNTQSKHYVKQSPFKGSNREKRSNILKLILKNPSTESQIIGTLGYAEEIVQKNLSALEREGLIKKIKNTYIIT
jgi:A/G-specific adenine glycosylase